MPVVFWAPECLEKSRRHLDAGRLDTWMCECVRTVGRQRSPAVRVLLAVRETARAPLRSERSGGSLQFEMSTVSHSPSVGFLLGEKN